MSARNRLDGNGAVGRRPRTRILLSLLSAAALVMGPGALAANADAAQPEPVTQSTAAAPADVPQAAEAPAPPPAPEPAPAPEPVPVVQVPPPPTDTPAPAALPVVDPAGQPPAADVTEPATAVVEEPATTTGGDGGDQAPGAAPAAMSASQAAPQAAKGDPPVPPEGTLGPQDKIQVCHAKGAGQGTVDDPYVSIPPNVDGVHSGHSTHTGPIPFGDIYPSFQYEKNGEIIQVASMNWTAEGEAIWRNSCNLVTPDPEPDPGTPNLAVQPLPCVVEGQTPPASVSVSITGIATGNDQLFELSISNGAGFSDSLTTASNGMYILDTSPGWFGTYTVTISLDGELQDSEQVRIVRCGQPEPTNPPVIVIDFDQCSVSGEIPAEANVSISGLVYGQTYSVVLEGPNGEAYSDSVVGGEVDSSFVMPLDGVGEYTFTLARGEWSESQSFQVNDDCPQPEPTTPPAVHISFEECMVSGTLPTSATVVIQNLVPGTDYAVSLTGPDGETFAATLVGTELATELTVPLAGAGEYTFALMQGDVTDHWTFTVEKDCKVTPVPPKPPVNPTPVVKVTPPAVKPALAVTGSEPLTGLIAGATFLVLVSGALVLAGRRQKQL